MLGLLGNGGNAILVVLGGVVGGGGGGEEWNGVMVSGLQALWSYVTESNKYNTWGLDKLRKGSKVGARRGLPAPRHPKWTDGGKKNEGKPIQAVWASILPSSMVASSLGLGGIARGACCRQNTVGQKNHPLPRPAALPGPPAPPGPARARATLPGGTWGRPPIPAACGPGPQ